jgi:hypothetical protein
MDFTVTQRFAAPVDRVVTLYGHADFFTSLPATDKLATPELVSHDVTGSTVELQLRYRFIGDLPSAVLRFVDPSNLTWVERTTIDTASGRSTSVLVPDTYPDLLKASADAVFASVDDGATRTVRGTVTVPVPLLGGKVEGVIVEGLEQYLHAEAQAAASHLGD